MPQVDGGHWTSCFGFILTLADLFITMCSFDGTVATKIRRLK